MADIINNLMEMRGGKVAAEINRKYEELLSSVFEHRKKGSITIKIDIEPAGFDQADMSVTEIRLAPDVTLKKPDKPLDTSMFFVNKQGQLSRVDPNQETFQYEAEVKQNG